MENIETAREKYRPEKIRCLFIAEAPPNALDRFFYYEHVKEHDHLFLGVIDVLYPELKQEYMAKRRPRDLKVKILRKFQNDGFYLIDLLDVPMEHCGTTGLEKAIPPLIAKVKNLVHAQTPIIIIKSNLFVLAYKPLIDAGYKNIFGEKVPFPSSGQQGNFRLQFTKALKKLIQ